MMILLLKVDQAAVYASRVTEPRGAKVGNMERRKDENGVIHT